MPLEFYAGLTGPQIEMLLEHAETPVVKVVANQRLNQTRDALLHRQYLRSVNSVGRPKATVITPLGHSFLLKAFRQMDEHLSRWNAIQEEKFAVAAIENDLYVHAHVNDENKIDITVVAGGQGGTLAHHESTTLPEECEVA